MKKISTQIFAALICLLLFLGISPLSYALSDNGYGDVAAQAALLIDIRPTQEKDALLYDKDMHSRRFPASITKVMTALLVLEAIDRGEISEDTVLTCSAEALAGLPWDASSVNTKVGEQLKVHDLLYCLMLPSANESANMLAEGVSGNIPDFVAAMNARAAELGMVNTQFKNPSGLHSNEHYSSAYDIYLMAREAMQHPLFQDIVSTAKYTVPSTNLSEERQIYSTNALLSSWRFAGYLYSSAIGIKTGYTSEAGYCLVSAAKEKERTQICVVLGADNPVNPNGSYDRQQFAISTSLLKWGFKNFKYQSLAEPGITLEEIPVALGKNVSHVLGTPAETVNAMMPLDFDPDKVVRTVELAETRITAPVKKGQVLGTITISYEGTDYGTYDLVANSEVTLSIFAFVVDKLSIFFGNLFVRIGLVLLLIYLVYRYYKTAQRKPRRGNRKAPSNTTPYPGPGYDPKGKRRKP